ncbi:MAG: hypothetical protein B7Z66_09315 [Chromatiales bacterium 21-64-14]|nr:MAG: hypothetical protein B7Z66_09315 [Chromatiales bacterium 21-64-14]HQU16194.1 copper resistance protein B [Gammaproteobacteria bacterium]
MRRPIQWYAAALALGLLLGPVAYAQQPTKPGWPQPVQNNLPYSYWALNQNELRTWDGNSTYRWEGEGWYGGNINRAWFKTEGNLDTTTGKVDEGELQALYSRAITRYFDLQTGVRYDFKPGPSRGWGAFGVQGLAPYFFEVAATGFVSNDGYFAARLEGSYDLLITQRLILQPQAELNFYTKSDPRRRIGSGLESLDSGLRLRYEIRRQFAPYIGVTYEKKYGRSADYARQDGASVEDLRFVTGIRLWF